MKLGISYPIFCGVELLHYNLKNIRKEIDFISVVYQPISYKGNTIQEELIYEIQKLKKEGYIDYIAKYENKKELSHKENECQVRYMGLELSKNFGCTHHISSDVDEFYKIEELRYSKTAIKDYDCLIVEMDCYYKEPNWKLIPNINHIVPLIHSVDLNYNLLTNFPYNVDVSRKVETKNWKKLSREEFVVHHMSYIRRNIREKLMNSSHKYDIEKFIKNFNKYKLGDIIALSPEYLNRKTILVDNYFNIKV